MHACESMIIPVVRKQNSNKVKNKSFTTERETVDVFQHPGINCRNSKVPNRWVSLEETKDQKLVMLERLEEKNMDGK